MKNIQTIFRREFAAYFNVPIAYIFIVVFLAVNSGLFMTSFFLSGSADMRGFFSLLPITLIVFIPAVTMRLWSEESKGGTIALLQSFPVSAGELVLGKFLASYLFYLIALAGTLVDPIWGRLSAATLGRRYWERFIWQSGFLSRACLKIR
jgi:ABC-2 type transport system permease protein